MLLETARPASPALRRELGRWDLTAIGVNQVIGGAVFALPAALFASAGAWSPWMVAGVGVASMLIGLSFAEAASRFDGTGGPYLYTRAAFGRFAAFEVGWMMWFTRAASWASVINVLVASLGFYWPALTAGPMRTAFLAAIIGIVAAINIRGIRQSSFVVNLFTIGKLLPLILFVAAGVFFVDWPKLAESPPVSLEGLSSSALLLIFAFGGYEVIPVPAGEAKDPRRAVPFALIMTIAGVTVLLILVADRDHRHAALARDVGDAAGRFGGALPRRRGSRGHYARRRVLDVRQQHGPGAFRIAQPVRPGRAGRSAAVLRPRPPPLPHARERDPRHVRRGPAARRLRDVPDDGRGERDQPADRLRRDLRVRASGSAAPASRPR